MQEKANLVESRKLRVESGGEWSNLNCLILKKVDTYSNIKQSTL